MARSTPAGVVNWPERNARIALFLDLENLLHAEREARDWAGASLAIAALVHAWTVQGTLVARVASCDRDMGRELAFTLDRLGIRVFTHEGGPDRADEDLIRRIERGLPASCDTVVIASGDHAFAGIARRLRKRGLSVEVVAPKGAIAAELYLAATDFHEFSGADTGLAELDTKDLGTLDRGRTTR